MVIRKIFEDSIIFDDDVDLIAHDASPRRRYQIIVIGGDSLEPADRRAGRMAEPRAETSKEIVDINIEDQLDEAQLAEIREEQIGRNDKEGCRA